MKKKVEPTFQIGKSIRDSVLEYPIKYDHEAIEEKLHDVFKKAEIYFCLELERMEVEILARARGYKTTPPQSFFPEPLDPEAFAQFVKSDFNHKNQ